MSNGATARAAAAIHDIFDAYQVRFGEITRRARARFERREWHAAQADATERLALYRQHVHQALAEVRAILGERVVTVPTWHEVKWLHAALIVDRPDCELAETFFNSVARRIFSTVGVNPEVEYVLAAVDPGELADSQPVVRRYPRDGDVALLARHLLCDLPFRAPWRDLARDAELVAARLAADARERWGDEHFDAVELLTPLFYRNKGAYVVGRVHRGDDAMPLLLALMNPADGITVDAVLTTTDEASIVFGFSWSYFRVDVPQPSAMVEFLRTLMPLKRVDELYTALGYNKHGKTVLYRSLVEHLERSDAKFELAPGDQGLVMSVFMLPTFNVVFKVIKDVFGHPKRISRQGVRDKYQFVFIRDRVGRLADAQEFEHLEFRRDRFDPALLAHLEAAAGSTVQADGDRVVIHHLYTERALTPLNLYLEQADADAAASAIDDYGRAIKELAAANIFTGDMLLKNFGVTRHGRIVFYDYDELVLLTDCQFRALPQPATLDDEMSAEPWFYVGEQDVFPEEFAAFLVPPGALRDRFVRAHGDLLTVAFWRAMQEQVRAGDLMDVYPYPESRRLHRA